MHASTLPTPEDGEVDLYRIKTCADEDEIRRLENVLSEEEVKRAAGFRFARDRARYILMHGTLRDALSRYLGIDACNVRYYEGEHGKPYINEGPQFNISSSGDFGMIAVAASPVGIDIEKVNPEAVTWKMVDEVFSEAERKQIFSGNTAVTAQEIDSFFRGWVRKESLLKALGTGLIRPMNSVESRLDQACFKSEDSGKELWTIEPEVPDPSYRVALTIALRDQEPKIRTNRVWPV